MPADLAEERDSYRGCVSPTCRKLLPRAGPDDAASATRRAANFSGSSCGTWAPWASSASSSALASALPPTRWSSDLAPNARSAVALRTPAAFSCLAATSSSYFRATSRRSTRMPESTGPSSCSKACVFWCFERTAMALRRLVTTCTMSFSSPRNLAASSSRRSRAFFSASVFAASSSFVFAISPERVPKRALRPSISALSSASLASASATACFFSFSLVSHQQTILSYISASFPASASSSVFILCSSATTRCTGLLPSADAAKSRPHAASSCCSRAADCPARPLATAPRCAAAAERSSTRTMASMRRRSTGGASS
mmetsp:Transcript_104776/g.303246  ORF Transcript_104776/g.303246 Transcript_104776/m.303246 type:complete len:315 (-) Transcript_104776:22-966(-)